MAYHGDSKRTFKDAIENFLQVNDHRENLLLIFYSGCTYVHEKKLFLEPHLHIKPTVSWSEIFEDQIIHRESRILLILDTTNLRWDHYVQWWQSFSRSVGHSDSHCRVNLLAINGIHTQALESSLAFMASDHPNSFDLSALCNHLKQGRSSNQVSPLLHYMKGVKRHEQVEEVGEIKLFPLPPRLQLHKHEIFQDPQDQLLRILDEYTVLHQDGVCQVVKVKLDNYIQTFSPSSVSF